MAKRERDQANASRRGLSPIETLAMLAKIDATLTSFERTAPTAFASLGGRDVIQARSQMTCIGPVPRLVAAEWERFATEHANTQRGGAYR